MKYIGYIKWVMMVIGASRGNIAGGLIGLAVGYFIEEYLKDNFSIETEHIFKETKYKYTIFQKNLLALISEVVKADGYIHKEEIYFIKSYLLKQFGSIYSNMMLKTLKLQIDKQFDVEDICLGLKHSLKIDAKIKLVTFLFEITMQSGSSSIKEKKLIERIAKIIGITKASYENIINSKKKKEQEKSKTNTRKRYGLNPYSVLGITVKATDKEVKKAYRKMVLKYHPDKTDLEDEIATEKFSAISEAYHLIKLERNIK